MKTSVCKGCPWLRGVTTIGAGYCACRDTMVFETDRACESREDNVPREVWVSFGESGEPKDNIVAVFWNKPVYVEEENRYFDRLRAHDCEAEFSFDPDPAGASSDTSEILKDTIRRLLPALEKIKGTRKLLRVTIDIVDQ